VSHPVARRFATALLAAAALAGGVAVGQYRPGADPVEDFRQALKLEQYARNEEKQALAYRERNLKEKAGKLTALSDLSRALLLTEWQTIAFSTGFRSLDPDFEARQIDNQVRQQMIQRFADGIKKVLRSRDPDELAAVTNLLSETVVGASTLGATATRARDRERSLNKQLADLAPDLVPLTRSDSAEVRIAAARALGNFPTKPDVVVNALKALLDPERFGARTRLTAADSLANLVQVVSGRQTAQRSSEPGVGGRPDRARNMTFERGEEVNVYALVVPAAARGLSDPDPAVRRACVNAARQVTLSLRDMVPNVELPTEYITLRTRPPFPPAGRPWTAEERTRVNAARAEVREIHQDLDRVLPEFRNNVRALREATADRDAEVRVLARHIIEDLAVVRRLLTNLDAFLPADPARPLPAPREKAAPEGRPKVSLGAPVRTGPAPLPRAALGAPALPARPAAAAPAPGLVQVRLEQAAQDKNQPDTEADPLLELAVRTRLALIQESLRDPSPQGRLAAIDALELFGAQAEPAIPALAEALNDRNRFVRWAAARALGRLGLGEREALPGLVRMLCDQDLDVRVAAMEALRRYGPKVPAAVPALTAWLGRGDTESRIAALGALGAIGRAAEPSLPAMARGLKNPDPRMRSECTRTIGLFGKAAVPFIPALRGAMADPDSDVRRAASEAILRIKLGQ
jgi:HEAT repeat protein